MKSLIADFIEQLNTRFIHVHDIQIARSVFELKKKYNLHITLDLHENRPEIMKHYKHVKSLSGRLLIYPNQWKKFEEKYVRDANKVVVVTDFAKSELEKRAGVNKNKIVVVPNTSGLLFTKQTDFNETVVNKLQGDFTLLYIGDTSERRGLLTAIEAVNLLQEKIKTLKLVIVGKSSFDATLKKRVQALNLSEKVIFEGWQDPAILPSYIKGSSIGISPLYKNLHHDTTYANKIFQYMSLGKPILVSDCLAQEEVVKEANCGLVFKNKSAEDFAEKVSELYSNESQFEKYSKNAKIAVENKYNWKNTSKGLVEYYQLLQFD